MNFIYPAFLFAAAAIAIPVIIHFFNLKSYKTVYFAGTKDVKKTEGKIKGEHNCNYDDEKGDYKVVMGDHIAYRYEV